MSELRDQIETILTPGEPFVQVPEAVTLAGLSEVLEGMCNVEITEKKLAAELDAHPSVEQGEDGLYRLCG